MVPFTSLYYSWKTKGTTGMYGVPFNDKGTTGIYLLIDFSLGLFDHDWYHTILSWSIPQSHFTIWREPNRVTVFSVPRCPNAGCDGPNRETNEVVQEAIDDLSSGESWLQYTLCGEQGESKPPQTSQILRAFFGGAHDWNMFRIKLWSCFLTSNFYQQQYQKDHSLSLMLGNVNGSLYFGSFITKPANTCWDDLCSPSDAKSASSREGVIPGMFLGCEGSSWFWTSEN